MSDASISDLAYGTVLGMAVVAFVAGLVALTFLLWSGSDPVMVFGFGGGLCALAAAVFFLRRQRRRKTGADKGA